MKRNILFLISIAISFSVFAQTRISGTVPGGEGQNIRLITYDDFISERIVTLGVTEINDDESFSMDININETMQAFLDINYQRTEIFIEPGKSYELNIEYDGANQLASYFNQKELEYAFTTEDSTELNRLIWKFNGDYNKFILDNFDQIYVLHDKSRVKKFKDEVDTKYANLGGEYFKNYIRYKLADVEQFARLKSKGPLAEEYFHDQPILYKNVEYTFFFNEFFEKFLVTSPSIITISDLIIYVNDETSLQMIEEKVAAVPYLQDENFRELVLIHGLKGLAYNGTYERKNVLNMIAEIGNSSQNAMHKKISNNLIQSINKLAPGSPAPDIEVVTIGGNTLKIKNIKGKPILLTFFRSGQTGTQASFDQLAELYNVYRSGLEVISISMDNDPEAYIPLANSGNYSWTFAHFGNDPLVFDQYNIRNLPLYVLIDVEGNIAAYPAPGPGDELEKLIMKVIH